MAARRLIIVLLVLFAVSIVAAMIAPERRGPLLGDRSTSSTDSTSTASTTTTTTTEATDATTTRELHPGEALTARIQASAAKPASVRASVGDQLELNVGSDRAREIEIPAFGVTEVAAPDAPAAFNLLLREPGRLPIIDADTGELLGRLDVDEPRSGDKARGTTSRNKAK